MIEIFVELHTVSVGISSPQSLPATTSFFPDEKH